MDTSTALVERHAGISPVRPARRTSPQSLRIQLYLLIYLCDITALAFGFVLPWVMLDETRTNIPAIFLLTSLIYTGFAFNSGAYSLRTLQSMSVGTGPAIRSLLFAYGALFLISYFFRAEQDISRLLLSSAMASAAIGLISLRQLIALYVNSRVRGRLLSQLLIRDGVALDGPRGFDAVDAQQIGLAPNLRDPQMLDLFAGLLRDHDRVVIACRSDRRKKWAMMLKGANIHGEILVNDFDSLGALGVGRVDGHQTLTVSLGPLSLRDRLAKRAFDLAFCVPALIALAPVFLITALAIKLDSPGPVFFRQRRVGRGNAFFEILKFRSMHVEQCDPDGRVSTRRDDKRITRVGMFIRRTSIDELPQLLNVLFGQMSIVGPRPHALGSLAGEHLFWDIDERYWHRHALKPGITGLAQVRGFRGATHHSDDLTRRLQADLEYIDHWSFWKDLAILVSTVKVIIHRNTY